ncbi:hypothetical protein ZIOFF_018265 [Zingiber officinale]|uniref:Uncharacterized protein n=1 Tax=Zingiber officinale TaxID=94328 RepID=A0A8J5H682_ZINOF|nr:hypothetical protein ZIOFF_018265 [Zingiber officinale]
MPSPMLCPGCACHSADHRSSMSTFQADWSSPVGLFHHRGSSSALMWTWSSSISSLVRVLRLKIHLQVKCEGFRAGLRALIHAEACLGWSVLELKVQESAADTVTETAAGTLSRAEVDGKPAVQEMPDEKILRQNTV